MHRTDWILCAVVAALTPMPAARALTPRELRDTLAARGVAFDEAAMDRAAVRGMLAVADPHAKLLAPGEWASLRAQRRPIVAAEDWPGGVLYLRLGDLGEGHGSNVVARLEGGRTNGMPRTGLILDLREATGSNISSFETLTAALLHGREWGYAVVSREGGRTERRAPAPAATNATPVWPVMALVGPGTLESPEVMASVLQQTRRALVLGERTSGDGRLREMVPLGATQCLYVATARLAPAGLADGEAFSGVVPDIAVTNRTAARAMGDIGPLPDGVGRPASSSPPDRRCETDPVLRRAVDILVGINALRGLDDGAAAATNTVRAVAR